MLFHYKIHQELDITIIGLFGELMDKNSALPLQEEVQKLIDAKQLKFVFDMGQLKYLNSSGLGVFINLLTRIRKNGGELVISNVSDKVRELLVITKLTTLFTVTDSIDKAITKLK